MQDPLQDYKTIREFILRLMRGVDLQEANTLRDLKGRIGPDDWSRIEERVQAGQFTEETTILELLMALQNADIAPEND